MASSRWRPGSMFQCLRSSTVSNDAALAKDVRRNHYDGNRAGQRGRMSPHGLVAMVAAPRVVIKRFLRFLRQKGSLQVTMRGKLTMWPRAQCTVTPKTCSFCSRIQKNAEKRITRTRGTHSVAPSPDGRRRSRRPARFPSQWMRRTSFASAASLQTAFDLKHGTSLPAAFGSMSCTLC